MLSSLGSLAGNAGPTSKYYSQRSIGYNTSKAALNLLTIQFREELRGSVRPSFVRTDLTGYGDITPDAGARLSVRYALDGDENGRFLEAAGKILWQADAAGPRSGSLWGSRQPRMPQLPPASDARVAR